MKALQLMMIFGITTLIFNINGMDHGDKVIKEKKNEVIENKDYSFKTFRQSRVAYNPVQLFISRSKNKQTGNTSFSGGVSTLVLHETRLEYTTYLGGTTDLTDGEFTKSKWEELKNLYKVQKIQ